MQMVPVQSSAIAEIGWEKGVLAIRFHSRREPYFYPNVPEQLFTDFENAQSKGKFFHEHIKDNFTPLD